MDAALPPPVRVSNTLLRRGVILLFLKRASAIALVLAFFISSLALFVEHNHFPIDYHPDEPGKAEQVAKGRRNYRHPQMLLELSTWAALIHGQTKSYPLGEPVPREVMQATVQIGRGVSAVLAAATVALLALAAYRTAGLPAMLVCGIGLATCGPLLVYAHYMKEEPALTFGLAASVLAGWHVWHGRLGPISGRIRRSVILGAACALAMSGKYVGAVVLLPSLWLLLPPDDSRIVRKRLLIWFLIGLATVWVAINWRVFKAIGTAGSVFGNQVIDGVEEHKGLTMSRPTPYFMAAWLDVLPFYVSILVAVGALVGIDSFRRRRDRWMAVVGLGPIGFLAIVSFATQPNYRYVLPAVVMSHFTAAVLLGWAIRKLPVGPWIGAALAVAAAGGVMFLQGPAALALSVEFSSDSRELAAQWVADLWSPGRKPAPGLLLAEKSAFIIRPDDPMKSADLSQVGKVIVREFAPMFGPFESLRKQGVTHVAVCETAYFRYFEPAVKPTPAFIDEYHMRREWYEHLFKEGVLVWSSPARTPTHADLNPLVRIYKLPAGPATRPAETDR